MLLQAEVTAVLSEVKLWHHRIEHGKMVQQNHVIEYSSGEEPRLFYFGSLGGSLIIVAVGFFLTTLIYAVPIIIAFAFAQNRGTVFNQFARLFQTENRKKSQKNRRKLQNNQEENEKYDCKFLSFQIY